MKIFLIIEFVINALLLLWFHMHMFQLNSYFLKKNIHWMCKNKIQVLTQLILIVISIIFVQLDSYWSQIACAITLLMSIIYNLPKGKSKIPLKLTSRVKRMFVTEFIINTIILFIFGITEHTLIKLEVINILSVFLCMIANIINYPIETMVRQWFINDAKKILKNCPNLIIIGVTGSYGKTSVKNFLAKTLSSKYEVLATPQNYNTTMGVVKTIRENLKSTHQVFICEMGATKLNDIKEICDLVHPQYGVVTSIGPQHLESFKSIENVIKTKLELADSVKEIGGTVFINCDNKYLKEQSLDMDVIKYGVNDDSLNYNGYELYSSERGVSFKVKDEESGKEIEFTTKAIGRYNVVNIMAAIAVANKLGIKMESMIPRIREIKNVDHRLQLLNKGNINIIDDSYNSNPVSSKFAIDTLGEFDGIKIIVTPGLIELGDKEDQYNFELGEYITTVCDYAFLVGEHSRKVQEGIKSRNFDQSKIFVVVSPQEAMQRIMTLSIQDKITVLLENDLPDNYK